MRVLVFALSMALLGASSAPAQESAVALQKLEQLRAQRKALANRNRLAIIFSNETPIAGAEKDLINETATLFGQRGYEIVAQESVAKVTGSHAKGAPWTNEELAAVADGLGVETVVIGVLKEYKAKKHFGVPLPSLWIRTKAEVAADGAVYRRSQNNIVWKDSISRQKRQAMGTYVGRDETRRNAAFTAVDELYKGYLNRKS
jgi:hypothetical protein